MAHRNHLEHDRSPLNEDWTSQGALKSIVLVGLLIAFFLVLSVIFTSPDYRSVQTQPEPSQPFTRAE
jgi:hypothetical protein